jgi:hypothetical protein
LGSPFHFSFGDTHAIQISSRGDVFPLTKNRLTYYVDDDKGFPKAHYIKNYARILQDQFHETGRRNCSLGVYRVLWLFVGCTGLKKYVCVLHTGAWR